MSLSDGGRMFDPCCDVCDEPYSKHEPNTLARPVEDFAGGIYYENDVFAEELRRYDGADWWITWGN